MAEQTSTPIEALAQRLDEAAQAVRPVPQLTAAEPLSPATAYQVQSALISRRLARGEQLVGLKLGLTSKAKMAQVGVDEMIWGRLTDRMRLADGDAIDLAELIHPRAEPEVAFRLDATGRPEAVAAALEVIDSRYTDFRFSLPDVIADNSSAARFVIGPWCPVPPGLANLGVLLEVDGRVVQTGSTAAILGDPYRALARGLALAAADAGLSPQSGWILLAGAATAAQPLRPASHVRVVVEGLGTATLTT